MTTDISVVICTHNRAVELDRTLATIAAQWRNERASHEVFVVDNCSTDDTPRVAARWRDLGAVVSYSLAPVLGLSNARNHALTVVTGELILFLDDDVNVMPGVLDAYLDAARRYSAAAFFGGPIVPVFEASPSTFALAVAAAAAPVFSGVDLGREERELMPSQGPWGANMCLRSAAIGALRFNPALSYYGRGGIVGDETDFLARLAGVHGAGRWVPDAKVEHRIPAHRATKAFFRRSAISAGRAALQSSLQDSARPPLSPRLALWYSLRAVKNVLGAAIDFTAPAEARVRRWYVAWGHVGTASEAWRCLTTSPRA